MLASFAFCVLSVSFAVFAHPHNARSLRTETQVVFQTSTETITSTSTQPASVSVQSLDSAPVSSSTVSSADTVLAPQTTYTQAPFTPTTSSVSSAASPSSSSSPDTILFLPPSAAPSSSSSSSVPTPTNTSVPLGPLVGPIIAAYYPDWVLDTFPPESIDFSRIDWIDYAFTWPAENFSLVWDSDESPAGLQRLVTAAHAAGSNVKLSVGGWDGGMYFSAACSTAENRETFAQNLANVYQQYNLDGIDIDWEFPGETGHPGNEESPQDTSDFLDFLKVLRATLPVGARITAAAQVFPFVDAFGAPSSNISAFAEVLDWVLIENYDTFGSSSDPGPNAPLSDGCHNSSQPQSNAVSAVQAWTSSDFPPSKIMLGVPSYGYVNAANATSLHQRRSLSRSGFSRRAKSSSTDKPLSLKSSDDNSSSEGQIQFNEIISQGAIMLDPYYSDSASESVDDQTTSRSVPSYVGTNGFTRYFDTCSSTPFLVSPSADQVITYDDPQSLEMKATYAYQAGLLGAEMFDISGDTDDWALTDGLRRGLGII